ncbi:MAG: carboxypeptidase-like regulatory domain-containing protein, partial [Bacteroidia bacterium]|nr:carboxypeptidase-like regulatory domain-containing protein [Bacteroidia bacterium]
MTKYLIVMLLLVSQSVLGQRVLELPIDEKYVGQSLAIMLEEISTEQGATFFYLPEWLEDLSINTDHTGLPLGNVLDQLFQGTDLVYLEMYPNSIVIVKDPSQALLRRETIEKAIAQGKIIIDYQLGAPGANTPETVEVTGKISDWSSQDPLPFASIAINDTVFVTSTDSEGHYRLVLSPGEYVMEVGFLGYEEKIIVLAVYENGIIDFELEKESTELEEVVVEGKQSLDVSTSGIGKSILNLKEIKRAPAFLGEADMVKQVQIMA